MSRHPAGGLRCPGLSAYYPRRPLAGKKERKALCGRTGRAQPCVHVRAALTLRARGAANETVLAYPSQMGRKVHHLVMGPAGTCETCGRSCCTLHEVGNPCYFCARGDVLPGGQPGVFMHRRFWHYTACPFCDGRDPPCLVCFGNGVLASPREDIEEHVVREEWRSIVDQAARSSRSTDPAVDQLASFLQGK